MGDGTFTFGELLDYVAATTGIPTVDDTRASDFRYPGNYEFYRHALAQGFRARFDGREVVFDGRVQSR